MPGIKLTLSSDRWIHLAVDWRLKVLKDFINIEISTVVSLNTTNYRHLHWHWYGKTLKSHNKLIHHFIIWMITLKSFWRCHFNTTIIHTTWLSTYVIFNHRHTHNIHSPIHFAFKIFHMLHDACAWRTISLFSFGMR